MNDMLAPIAAVMGAGPAVVIGPLLLAVLAAAGVLAATWGVVVLQRPSLVAARLGSMGPAPRSLEDLELQRSFVERVLQPMIQGAARLVYRYTPQSTVEQYRRQLIVAGSPGGLEVRDFLGIKGLLAVGLGGGYFLLSGVIRTPMSPVVTATLLAVLGYYLPNIMLQRRMKRRQNEIQRALPDTLDLLTVCVEAGLGFDGAIGRVVEKRQDELSREFGRVLAEMRMGRTRRDALRSLVDRTEVQDVSTFISSIIQSEQLGVSISRVLLTQAEQMRTRRRQRAEELAHKAPIKMLFPMVFLIFPSIFVVILGPAIPGILKTLG